MVAQLPNWGWFQPGVIAPTRVRRTMQDPQGLRDPQQKWAEYHYFLNGPKLFLGDEIVPRIVTFVEQNRGKVAVNDVEDILSWSPFNPREVFIHISNVRMKAADFLYGLHAIVNQGKTAGKESTTDMAERLKIGYIVRSPGTIPATTLHDEVNLVAPRELWSIFSFGLSGTSTELPPAKVAELQEWATTRSINCELANLTRQESAWLRQLDRPTDVYLKFRSTIVPPWHLARLVFIEAVKLKGEQPAFS